MSHRAVKKILKKVEKNLLTNRTLCDIMCIQGKGAVKLIEKATDTNAKYGKGETEIFLKQYLTNPPTCDIMNMSRGELPQTRPQQTVETETHELKPKTPKQNFRLRGSVMSDERVRYAHGVQDRNKPVERTDVKGIKKIVANIF